MGDDVLVSFGYRQATRTYRHVSDHRPDRAQSPLQPRVPDVAQSHLFFLVLPNELPETFCRTQTCRAIVVLQRDARIGVM